MDASNNGELNFPDYLFKIPEVDSLFNNQQFGATVATNSSPEMSNTTSPDESSPDSLEQHAPPSNNASSNTPASSVNNPKPGDKRKNDSDWASAKDARSTLANGDAEIGPHHPHPSNPDDSESSKEENGGNSKSRSNSVHSSSNNSNNNNTSARRKEQNRNAQRAFRERKEKHIKELQAQVDELLQMNNNQNHENEALRDLIINLQQENQSLRKKQKGDKSNSSSPNTSIVDPSFPFSFEMSSNLTSNNNNNNNNNNIGFAPFSESFSTNLSENNNKNNNNNNKSSNTPSTTSTGNSPNNNNFAAFSPSNFLNDLDSIDNNLSSNTTTTNQSSRQGSVDTNGQETNNNNAPPVTNGTSPPTSTFDKERQPPWSTEFSDYRSAGFFSPLGDLSGLFGSDFSPLSSTLGEDTKEKQLDPDAALDHYRRQGCPRRAKELGLQDKQFSFDEDALCSEMKAKATCTEYARKELEATLQEDEKRLAEAFPLNS